MMIISPLLSICLDNSYLPVKFGVFMSGRNSYIAFQKKKKETHVLISYSSYWQFYPAKTLLRNIVAVTLLPL